MVTTLSFLGVGIVLLVYFTIREEQEFFDGREHRFGHR